MFFTIRHGKRLGETRSFKVLASVSEAATSRLGQNFERLGLISAQVSCTSLISRYSRTVSCQLQPLLVGLDENHEFTEAVNFDACREF